MRRASARPATQIKTTLKKRGSCGCSVRARLCGASSHEASRRRAQGIKEDDKEDPVGKEGDQDDDNDDEDKEDEDKDDDS